MMFRKDEERRRAKDWERVLEAVVGVAVEFRWKMLEEVWGVMAEPVEPIMKEDLRRADIGEGGGILSVWTTRRA